MTVSVSWYNIEELMGFIFVFFMVSVFVMAGAVVIYYCVKNSDEITPLISKREEILEKTMKNGNIEI